MDLRRAATYPFADPRWARKLAPILLVSPLPIVGQLFAFGYAYRAMRGMLMEHGAGELPEAALDRHLLWDGVRVVLMTLLCGIVVAILGAFLFIGQEPTEPLAVPALVQALQGPSYLVVAFLSAVVSAAVLARLAETGTVLGALQPDRLWSLLRAEPAIWISYAAVGMLVVEGPLALIWALDLGGALGAAAVLLASTVLWTYGLLVQSHLIAQAHRWANRTATMRAAAVRYRW